MDLTINVIKIHVRNRLMWFLLPWAIVLSSFAINAIIGFLLGGNVTIYTGGLASIYLFMLVLGYMTLNDSFPFALGFSVRRTDYFLGTLVMVIGVGVISAILLTLLSLVEVLTGNWGISLHFFHLPYVADGPFIAQFWVYFVAMIHFYMLGFVQASIYQRFGRAGLITFYLIVALLASIVTLLCAYYDWWPAIFLWFVQYSAFELASWIVLPTVVYMLASYLLLRKATI
jgi:hypothetical protein